MITWSTWKHITVQTNQYYIRIVTWNHMIIYKLVVLDWNFLNHEYKLFILDKNTWNCASYLYQEYKSYHCFTNDYHYIIETIY